MTFQQDLGADSLDVVELVTELEDEFAFKFRRRCRKHFNNWRRGKLYCKSSSRKWETGSKTSGFHLPETLIKMRMLRKEERNVLIHGQTV